MLDIGISYSKFATAKSGGARESLLTLLNGVAKIHDMQVTVYQTPPVDDEPDTKFEYRIHVKKILDMPKLTWVNQVITRRQWRRYLGRTISADHDLLITQNRLAPASIRVANELDIPSLCFIRSLALTGYEKYTPTSSHLSNLRETDLGGRIQYPFLAKNFRDYKWATNNATRTIANSEFTSGKINELFGVDPSIIYPPIKLQNYRTEYDGDGCITMVNPREKYKGPDVFLDIADRLLDEQFLLVGPIGSTRLKERASRAPNVTHWEWCEDMRKAYSATKVVVVPSRVEESFGRVPAEAMVSGIPCVVSNRGGLPEVVGDTGKVVERVESTQQWVDAIRDALTNHDPDAQKRRVERFSARTQVTKLAQLIDETTNSEGELSNSM